MLEAVPRTSLIESASRVARSMGEQGWDVRTRSENDAQFKIITRDISGIKVIERWLGDCRGRRSEADAAAARAPFLAFLYVVSGREKGRGEGREFFFEPGDTAVWHSSQSLEFEVLEPLHKLIFVIPEKRLGGLFPNCYSIRNVHIKGDRGLGPFIASHLATLADNLDILGGPQATSVIDMTLEMLARAVAGEAARHSPTGDRLLTQVFAYIDKHLEDPDLSPQRIATAHGVSLRYLHLLFSRNHLTVSGWIRESRLRRCRNALELEGRGTRVTEIAYRWGFKDPAHFSRLFKRRFGLAPTQMRGGPA